MTGYRRPRRASTKALAIGEVVLALWFAWAYRDVIVGWIL